MNEKLSPSLEDYLEAIFQISTSKPAVRSKDIAQMLHVTRSSVTGALQALSEKGLVHYQPYEVITLTAKGNAAAKQVAGRHAVLLNFLTAVLGMDQKKAEVQACRLEHALSPEVARRLFAFMEFLDLCPRGRERWVERFKSFCSGGEAVCTSCSAGNSKSGA